MKVYLLCAFIKEKKDIYEEIDNLSWNARNFQRAFHIFI